MASTQRTASGKWTSRIYIGLKDGKKQYKRFTADTKKEAERLAHTYAVNLPTEKHGGEMTLREAMEAYIASKNNVLSPSTVAGYRRIVAHRFKSLMDLKIRDLEKSDYQKAVNDEAAQHSPKTVLNAVGLLTASLSLQRIDVSGLTLPQEKKIEVVIPTDDEMQLLCAESEKWNISLPVHLAAYMGLRRSEICALDLRKDFNLKNNTVRIDKAIVVDENNERVLKGTKTKNSTRTLSIPGIVLPVLKTSIENNYTMPTPAALDARFIKMKRSIDLDHITFHSLRHYFASTLVVLNIPDFYALKLMGHGTDLMLKTVYQHVRQDYMNQVSSKMDDFFSSKKESMTNV